MSRAYQFVDAAYIRVWAWGVLLLHCTIVADVRAGGSGLNTVVVINQNSVNSRELANYFCERRLIPPENVLRINWAGDNRSWSDTDFSTHLFGPLLSMLAERQLTNQIDYLVLSMDIPFQTISNGNVNATTSALFYGLKQYGGTDTSLTNSYAQSEMAFRQALPASASGNSFLATMITGESIVRARQLVDQGVVSDGKFPTQPVVLAKTSDPARNLRHLLFDNATINVKIRDVSTIVRVNSDNTSAQSGLFGAQTGLDRWTLSPGTFVAGAVADSMTSFGGIIFGPNAQSNLLSFLSAGAAGSYGTVAEPLADTQKFPDPQVYFYQARGFSLAESYYQSLVVPHLGLIVAEPLAAPFARTGTGRWDAGLSNAILTGNVELPAFFYAADAKRPLQQVDLFVDGKYLKSVTNLSPSAGNSLTVLLNGYPITYTVPINAALSTIAQGLAAQINTPLNTVATKVKALTRGDRIELQSTATDHQSFAFYLADTNSLNANEVTYRIRYLPESFPPRFLSSGNDKAGGFRLQMEIPTPLPYTIQASTNLIDWVPIATNLIAGVRDYLDLDATNYASRYYRLIGPVPNQPPKLSSHGLTNGGAFVLQLESLPGQACAVLASSNLVDWTPLFTNQPGGIQAFVDTTSATAARRFYRAWLTPTPLPDTTVIEGESSPNLIRIEGATRPYMVEVSTKADQWLALATNFAVGDIQTVARSAAGNAQKLTTFLHAERPFFLHSSAFGFQKYSSFAAMLAVGDWLEFTITKTNGLSTTVAITNQSSGISSAILWRQIYDRINAAPALQGSDGVVAEDLAQDSIGNSSFYLRARSPGYQAAGVGVQVRRSGIVVLPSAYRPLRSNFSDLQPRNHLYVTAGDTFLPVKVPLDTTLLADGHHELTAVAYEGSSVRTQTRCSVSVVISNSPLHAQLVIVGQPDAWPVTNSLLVTVTANTNAVGKILLYSTGGFLMGSTNQPASTFVVNSEFLGAGQHPFYALVTTTNGLRYRTETRYLRLVPP